MVFNHFLLGKSTVSGKGADTVGKFIIDGTVAAGGHVAFVK
jgi:hypothetical protein